MTCRSTKHIILSNYEVRLHAQEHVHVHVSNVIAKMMRKIKSGYIIKRGEKVSVRLRRSVVGVRYQRVFKVRTSERQIFFHDDDKISCECPDFQLTGVPCWHLICYNLGNLEPDDIHPRYRKCFSEPAHATAFEFRIKNRRPVDASASVYLSANTSDTEGEVSGVGDGNSEDEGLDSSQVINEVHDLHTSSGVLHLCKEIIASISAVPGHLYDFGSAMVQWRLLPRPDYPSGPASSVAGRQGSRVHGAGGRPL